MFSSPWLHNLLGLSRSRKDRRRQAAQRRRVRPMLEALEDRITPSTVTENAPDAATLQADLNNATAANTQYVINLTGATSAYFLTAGQELTVSAAASGSSVTITGTGQSITGNGNRIFLIAKGANVTLQDLTITGGKVTSTGNAQGGGIFDSGGNVTLSNVTVERSTVMGKSADGGGIFVTGGGNLTIKDSNIYANIAEGIQGINATNAGQNGTAGGSAAGGGLYVGGSGWTVTLLGDTLWGNLAGGGGGGNGAAGSKATGVNAQGGDGGNGGNGGTALGGGAFFSASANGSGSLTILNDLAAPTTHPSIMISNEIGAGGGAGGAGGASTGTANNSKGGNGGTARAEGAAVYIGSGVGATLTANIGNTAFFGNQVAGAAGGTGGSAGTGGSGTAGVAGTSQSGFAAGGALALEDGNVTVVNSTVATNLVYAGSGSKGGVSSGGGIYDNDAAAVTLDNNTITQNSLTGTANAGAGITVAAGNPILLNNLIQANYSSISTAADLDTNGATLSNAYNNYIASINPTGSVSAATNIILGDYPAQLGGVVGFTAKGLPSGGPIYYPLVPGTVSIAAGTTSDLSTIAAVEGTTVANAVDEIGTLRSSNGSTSGTIDLGAVQLRNVTENAADIAELQTALTNATAPDTLYIINLTGASPPTPWRRDNS